MKATAVSNALNANNTLLGTLCALYLLPPLSILVHANPAITFNRICPAIMFANNRTESEMTVIPNPNTSKGTMNGIIPLGVPAGRNLPNSFLPCLRNPMISFPLQITVALALVTIKCEVTVKL